MRGRHLAIAGACALLVTIAALGIATLGTPLDEDASSSQAPQAHVQGSEPGHDHAHGLEVEHAVAHQPRHDEPFPQREPNATTPTRAQASELPHQYKRFIVHGDEGLDEMRAEDRIAGHGTVEDPYVIHGFRVTERLEIKDTTKPLVIENSYIEGQLVLNFIGPDVHVHHNHIEDLRVNENVERNERATSGLIEHNQIPYVGQLRHFSGTFAHNDVGPKPDGAIQEYLSDAGPATLPDHVTFLLDGYHLAHVHNNTIDGHMEVKLHGHYHASCQACLPHDHADPEGFPDQNEPHETLDPRSHHSDRHHTIDLENNTFTADDEATALRIHDTDHAADDRTANSEPNAYLEERHHHRQYVRIAGNTIHGATTLIDVVNADDARHHNMTQDATLHLEDNHVTLEQPRRTPQIVPAYHVHAAEHTTLQARDNAYTFETSESPLPDGTRWIAEGEPAETTGFLLDRLNATHALIEATRGDGADYGVTLNHVPDTNRIDLLDNNFQAHKEDRHER